MDSCVDLHWEKNSLWMLVSKKGGELWKGWAVGSDPPPHSIATSQHIPWHPQLLRPEQQPRLSSASFFLLPLSAPFRKSRSQVPNEAALILSFSVKPCTGSKLFNLTLPAEGRSLGNQLWDLDITAHGEIFSRGMALHPPVVVRSDPISVNCLFPWYLFFSLISYWCADNAHLWLKQAHVTRPSEPPLLLLYLHHLQFPHSACLFQFHLPLHLVLSGLIYANTVKTSLYRGTATSHDSKTFCYLHQYTRAWRHTPHTLIVLIY